MMIQTTIKCSHYTPLLRRRWLAAEVTALMHERYPNGPRPGYTTDIQAATQASWSTVTKASVAFATAHRKPSENHETALHTKIQSLQRQVETLTTANGNLKRAAELAESRAESRFEGDRRFLLLQLAAARDGTRGGKQYEQTAVITPEFPEPIYETTSHVNAT